VFNTTAQAKAAALKEQSAKRNLSPLARTIIGLDR
jgi:hypothetical protein